MFLITSPKNERTLASQLMEGLGKRFAVFRRGSSGVDCCLEIHTSTKIATQAVEGRRGEAFF